MIFEHKNFLLLFVLFVSIDIFVISYNKKMWLDLQSKVGEKNINIQTGIVAWFLLVLGLYIFVLPKVNTISDAIVWSIIYAIIIYGVFDFTNMTLFPKLYTFDIAWRDIISGTITTVLTTVVFILMKQKNIIS